MTSDEVTYLICAEVRDSDDASMVPGSIQIVCTDCEKQVWCAPSGQRLLMSDEQTVVAVCNACGLKRMLEEEDEVEITIPPGVYGEISRALRQPPVP